jgi:hypothetical protein
VKLSYSETLQILAKVNDIAAESDGAFRARLRHFQRLGFPQGANTGRGKPADYDLTMLLQLVIATQFMQAGMAPTRIVDLINRNWGETVLHLLLAASPAGTFQDENGRITDPDIALCVSPESLRELSTVGEKKSDYFEAFYFQETPRLAELFNDPDFHPGTGVYYRWIIFLLRPLLSHFAEALQKVHGAGMREIGDELYEIVRQRSERVAKLAEIIGKPRRTASDGNP